MPVKTFRSCSPCLRKNGDPHAWQRFYLRWGLGIRPTDYTYPYLASRFMSSLTYKRQILCTECVISIGFNDASAVLQGQLWGSDNNRRTASPLLQQVLRISTEEWWLKMPCINLLHIPIYPANPLVQGVVWIPLDNYPFRLAVIRLFQTFLSSRSVDLMCRNAWLYASWLRLCGKDHKIMAAKCSHQLDSGLITWIRMVRTRYRDNLRSSRGNPIPCTLVKMTGEVQTNHD